MSRSRASTAIALGILTVVVLLPRLPGLGMLGLMQYNWFGRVERFINALATGNLADTFQNPHPGVILMWVTGIVLVIAREFYGPMMGPTRVWFYELAQVLWVLTVMPLLFLALRRALVVYGESREPATWIALLPCVLAAIDPMVITMTRAVSLDGPLGLEGALSVCLFLIALRTRRLADEVLAGVSAGLTVLTKMPGLVFVLGMGLWLLVRAVRERRTPNAHSSLLSLFVVPGAVIAAFIVAWPAMWVAPAQTLLQMAMTPQQAEDIQRADFTDLITSHPDEHGEDALLDVILHPHRAGDTNILYRKLQTAWQYYPACVLFKTPPLTLILVAVGTGLAFWAWRRRAMDPTLLLFCGLLLFALLYFGCMNIAAKKTWRYMVPFQAFLELTAGLVFVWLLRATWRSKQQWLVALLALPLLVQSAHVLWYAPHFLTYYNPLAGGRAVAENYILVYWGDGVGEAARYMDEHALRRPVLFMAKGSVGPRATIMLGDGHSTQKYEDAEFLVIDYRVLLQRRLEGIPKAYWENRRPDHIVWIHGIPYMWIYRIEHHAPGRF